MDFFNILDRLKRKYSSLILYCLLDRIPIIVMGDKPTQIENFLIELSNLMLFRKEFVFYTDFISKLEYENLIQNEDIDYNSQRAHIRCPCDVALKAMNQFDNFNSWVIGIVIPKQSENLIYIKNLFRKKTRRFLTIIISSNTVSVEVEGINIKEMDLTLEQAIFQKISQDTEKSIIKMKRVLSDKIKSRKLDNDLVKTLLDFEVEKNELKKNIFNKEIQNFYSGSKRAFFILSRLNLLNNLEMNVTIGNTTLLKTIDYHQASFEGIISAPLNRIITFINKEWGIDFSHLIENGNKAKKVDVGDKIQSMWG